MIQVHWHQFRMGPQEKRNTTIHEKIYSESIEEIRTPKTKRISLRSNKVHTSRKWREDTIYDSEHITRTKRQTEEPHSASMWQIPL